ncbi:MAG: DUF975 family protein [Lachnospiraceae bacterium]|nr:DUF975 family protein [Lachnospiraceae bacterium]
MASEYYTNAQLIDRSRMFLGGKYKRVISMTLSFFVWNYLFLLFDRMFSSALVAKPGLAFLSYPLSAALSLFGDMLLAGIAFYFLKLSCGQEYSNADLLYGFWEDAPKTFLIAVCSRGPGILAMIPFSVLFNMYETSRVGELLPWVVVSFLLGAAASLVFAMGLGLSFFLMLDFPNYSAFETVSLCWKKMSGQKMRFFLLNLRLLPYLLAGFLSLGIGMLWVFPLVQESYAEFYLDLMNPGRKYSFDRSI